MDAGAGYGRTRAAAWPAVALTMGLLAAIAAADGEAPVRRLVKATRQKDWIDLPPLAVVHHDDPTGSSWRQAGVLPGGRIVARKDFSGALGRQGWREVQRTVLASGPGGSELGVWARGRKRLLLMIWEEQPGRSGFAVGAESPDAQPGGAPARGGAGRGWGAAPEDAGVDKEGPSAPAALQETEDGEDDSGCDCL